ncbi:MAG: ImmA/IrrE family metallo-endopeptidase [Spirochaetes bacterium]|nr:ImmA/IrrE family metallo-endopeptidase [Spirochaetota bacterium]
MKNLNIDNIIKKLETLGLNQSDIAKELEVSRESVSKWFNNESFPKPNKLLKLSKLLKLKFDELVIKNQELEPVIAFRKKGNTVTKNEHIKRAIDMGYMLKKLAAFLTINKFKPATLIEPKLDYLYIEDIANHFRSKINIIDYKIEFEDLIGFFSELNAILIPVLWGKKNHHENALHIYLPDTMTTWIYINLDVNIFDFKFWMLHEIGHIISPELKYEVSEEFADAFAGAFLFPKELSEIEYKKIYDINDKAYKISYIKDIAEKYFISPVTISKQIDKYANHHKLPGLSINIYPATTNLNKKYLLLSDILFRTKNTKAGNYIKICTDVFKTSFFNLLKQYLIKSKNNFGFIERVLNIPVIDAKEIYRALINNEEKVIS